MADPPEGVPPPQPDGQPEPQQIQQPEQPQQQPAVDRIDAGKVKIPGFSGQKIRLWLAQVECAFAAGNIKAEMTKFNYLVPALDATVAEVVEDLILNPGQTPTPYTNIKARLIAEYEDSDAKKTRKLLEHVELGDRKPSSMLREMRHLGGNKVTDDFLRTLFIQRMPSRAQAVLATLTPLTLDQVATAADKIQETSQDQSSVFAVQHPSTAPTSQTPAADPNLTAILSKLTDLSTRMARLEVSAIRQPRDTTPGRDDRSRSRSRSRTPTNPAWCWYHNRFQARATRCQTPCTFPGDQENTDARR